MENINSFFNNKIVIIIILIIILFGIIYQFYSSSEHFSTDVSTTNSDNDITDKIFNQSYITNKKMINFKCTYNDKNYYLVNIPVSSCQKQDVSIDKPPIYDCSSSMLVLMEINELELGLAKYLSDLQIQEILCNTKKNLECKNNLPKPTLSSDSSSLPTVLSPSTQSTCEEKYPDCVLPRQYIHDFMVTEYKKSDTDKSTQRYYTMKGVSRPDMPPDISGLPTIISAYALGSYQVPVLCGDKVSIADAKLNIIETVLPNNGGIIGGLIAPITVKMEFSTKLSIKGNYVLVKGEHQIIKAYVGACKNSTCNTNGKQYIRICLFTDKNDPNILEFIPSSVY
jgi:hypothetical protein